MNQSDVEAEAARIAKGAASGTKPEGQIEFEILDLVKRARATRATRDDLPTMQPTRLDLGL